MNSDVKKDGPMMNATKQEPNSGLRGGRGGVRGGVMGGRGGRGGGFIPGPRRESPGPGAPRGNCVFLIEESFWC